MFTQLNSKAAQCCSHSSPEPAQSTVPCAKAWNWNHHIFIFPHVQSPSNLLFIAAGSDISAFSSPAFLGTQQYL